ncbi:hypothetical protein ACH95_05875 [Bacillus glycinifermentans]|uniref:Uncharacterized protein n=1 Tax=Bacillus glycinifermentans TaxID=1664069 RepID=A0A0J6F0M1_9BACI|nr:hypothetical protein ACH95_05875 [Bacillus glycinifermentans]KRT92964.1 hypothetical protein AB447_220750 [Bacillus glycinifermentans]
MNMLIFVMLYFGNMLRMNMRNNCFGILMILTFPCRIDDRTCYIWFAVIMIIHGHSPFLSFNSFSLLNYENERQHVLIKETKILDKKAVILIF